MFLAPPQPLNVPREAPVSALIQKVATVDDPDSKKKDKKAKKHEQAN